MPPSTALHFKTWPWLLGFVTLQATGVAVLFSFTDLSLTDLELRGLYSWLTVAALVTNLILWLILRQTSMLRRARNELQLSKNRLEESQRIAQIGHWEWDISSQHLFWSSELYRIFERHPEQFPVSYQAFLATIPPDDRERVQEAVDRTLEDHLPYSVEHRIMLPGGEEKILRETGELLFDQHGKPHRMLGTAQDITAQKTAEQELHYRMQMLTLTAETGMMLTRNNPLETTIQDCCEAMVKHLDAALARIWLIPEPERTLVLTASAGLHTRINGEFSRVPIDPRTKIGDIALHRRAKVSNQLLNDPQIKNPQWVEENRLRAMAGHPLIIDGKVVGVMAFFTRHHLPQSIIESLTTVADIIALGLERKQAEERLQIRARIIEELHDAIITTTPDGLISNWNRGAERLFGYTAAEARKNPLPFFLPPHELDFFQTEILPQVLEKGNHQFEIEIRTKSGLQRHADFSLSLLNDDGAGGPTSSGMTSSGMICYARDITQRKQSEEKIRLSHQFLEETSEAVVITDADARIIEVNRAFEKVTGYHREEVIGDNPRILKSGHHGEEFYRQMWHQLTTTGHWEGEIWSRRKNSEVHPKWLSISAVTDRRGRTTHYVGISSDLTAIKQTQDQLENLAHFDQLTGLPNRLLFHERLQQALTRARRGNHQSALLMFDLDRFKEVNDTLGHSAGDFILGEVAERLTRIKDDADSICRLGGDEFCLLLTRVDNLDEVAQAAQVILGLFTQPFQFGGHDLHLTPSIGISLFPDDADDTETLIKNADTAMYHTKKNGGNNFHFFQASMFETVLARMTLKNRLRQALEFEEFELYYQPKIDANDLTVRGVEALIRWVQPERGPISPAEFIPLAEETGLIVPIGEWVLRQACKQSRQWQKEGLPPLRIAVNLSAVQFQQPQLAASIAGIIRESGLIPDFLELEITESIIMENLDTTVATLRQLQEMGITLALDDFGTGYSSLGYLKSFPINSLKIDRTFVNDITTHDDDRAVVITIITLAHSLKMEVVAEGVETADQAAFLREKGCDTFQGYHFSRPLPAAEITRFLHERLPPSNHGQP
ncbi:EAL domain-containing protein [Desulfurivibrio dismutans]|uniref:EAL domain-containing protein n=1 Tax=Desulfurivibrio dismutans TaxID=1398908 RepID=UPI0023D9FF92|nr:EAL domain-containing protein [Desulfurivibrio alkaliphilus]MDF1613649.1 EAL domain-containing protein [Desulfurivibrio alkaliphilus]